MVSEAQRRRLAKRKVTVRGRIGMLKGTLAKASRTSWQWLGRTSRTGWQWLGRRSRTGWQWLARASRTSWQWIGRTSCASWQWIAERAARIARGVLMALRRVAPGVILIVLLVLFVYFVLGLAQYGSGSSCGWALPRWFGCVLTAHEALAAGLIGAAGALLAAWIAWSAIQQQINAERERMLADRVEAERLLAEELTDYADGMAAAWRAIVALRELPAERKPERTMRAREATAYFATRISRPEVIESYRAMAQVLGWERRNQYTQLIRQLEEFGRFRDAEAEWDLEEDALGLMQNASRDFEWCLPGTSKFFDGLWRRSPKAMTFAMLIERIAVPLGELYDDRK
jgi:hypothetical protein